MSDLIKGFSWQSQAYYWDAVKDNRAKDEFVIGKYAADGGCKFEFVIKFYEYGVQLCIFDDAFQALDEFSGVIGELKERGKGGVDPHGLYQILMLQNVTDMTRRKQDISDEERREFAISKLTPDERALLGVAQ